MEYSKWIVFNQNGKKIKKVTLKHPDNLHYKQIDPFDQELKKEGLTAVREETLQYDFLKGKTFKQKLTHLGYL